MKNLVAQFFFFIVLSLMILSPDRALLAAEDETSEYSFDDSEFEKKIFSFGGYAEMTPSYAFARNSSPLYRLRYYQENPGRHITGIDANVVPEMVIEKDDLKAFARGYASMDYEKGGKEQYTNDDWSHDLLLYEAYGTYYLNHNVTIDAGKKNLKWGKGYAWNPVAFVERPKNPDDPELAYEGFTSMAADFLFSFDGPLTTLAFTPVMLPVYDDLNDPFGKNGHLNLAGKLYLLLWDTDIDFLILIGESQGHRLGMDLSRNITTNLEIHGEAAFLPNYQKSSPGVSGKTPEQTNTTKIDAAKGLLGFRYLTELETTLIAEYYYDGTGLNESEIKQYYQTIETADRMYLESGNDILYQNIQSSYSLSPKRANMMRHYLYFRLSQKEPFSLLYFTPALTSIINLADASFSLAPEALYTAIDNLEMRLRYTWLNGHKDTEFGGKAIEQRVDLRLRYFF